VAKSSERDIGRLEGKVDALGASVADLTSKLVGDGQPGFIDRLARIEESLEVAADVAKSAVTAAEKAAKDSAANLGALSSDIRTLTGSVDAHHKTPHLWRILGKKSLLAALLAGIVVGHAVLESSPSFIAWVLGILGMPVPPLLGG